MSVVIETTAGDLTVDLFAEERPRTCFNFVKLCRRKYYNCCLFTRVEKDFVAQTGDTTGTGSGGDSLFYTMYGEQGRFFEREVKPRLKHEKVGTLSMVNNGEDMHGSQFFITLGENLDYLDGVHTVFGEVVEGLDVLLKLNETICDQRHRPYRDIRITHTVILDDPFDDPKDVEFPDRSPEPAEEVFSSDRIGVEEDIDDNDGKTMTEIEEEMKLKEANARAIVLEMIGDIPDAEVAPPENVLFICKLNPVTRDEDLEVIFSRFGQIKNCEVIRDHKSGESLQYAFIEFENVSDCEKAYFKMDNVLIDDRRIHVDFSQSVAKIKWKGKGRVEYMDSSDPRDFSNFSSEGKGKGRQPQDNRTRGTHRSLQPPQRPGISSRDRPGQRDGYPRSQESYNHDNKPYSRTSSYKRSSSRERSERTSRDSKRSEHKSRSPCPKRRSHRERDSESSNSRRHSQHKKQRRSRSR